MTAASPSRPDAIRRHNLALMLGHLHRDGVLTRAALTARLGMSRSTVGALVTGLTELGLVEESVPCGGSGVGRPSHVVGPHPAGPFVIAVDVGVTQLAAAAVGLGGTILARTRVAYGRPPGPAAVADHIAAVAAELTHRAPPNSAVIGLGVSVPGTVDRAGHTVGVAPNLGWRDTALGALLRQRLATDISVCLGNDADLSMLAEFRRGHAHGCQDAVYLIGRIGVGAGIIVNGAPMLGRDGRAGEVGHNVVDQSGPPCHCGKNGCLETVIGHAARLALADRARPPSEDHVAAVLADARTGDQRALRAVRTVAAWLGQALGNLVNTLNPQRVILGGSLSGVLELARGEIEAALQRYAFDAGHPVELCPPYFVVDSALLGAAELALTDLLADPVGVAPTGS